MLLPTKTALILEAKSRKLDKNALTKEEHGQLLVAQQWFDKNYDGYTSVRVVFIRRTRQPQQRWLTGAMH